MNTDFLKLIPRRDRQAVIRRLKEQHNTEPADYDLCTKMGDQYMDIINSTDGWRVCVCNLQVDDRIESREKAIEILTELFGV